MILSAVQTPIGRYVGGLASVRYSTTLDGRDRREPLGMGGARPVVSLLHELRRRGGRHGLATLCVGVGQGQAALFDRPA